MSGMGESADAAENSGASVAKASAIAESAKAGGKYNVECIGPIESKRTEYLELKKKFLAYARNGMDKLADEVRALMTPMEEVKWADDITNVVTDEGANNALDEFLGGTAYTAAWFMGLQNGAAATTASTYALPICTEITTYDEATRPAPAFAAAGTPTDREKTTSSVVAFSMNATVTVDGAMLSDFATKGNTAEAGAVLYSAGDFTGGSKNVDAGDTINVTYTASL